MNLSKINKKYLLILFILIMILVLLYRLSIAVKINNNSKNNNELDYYNPLYKKRYSNYKKKNKQINFEQVIKNVNMHLDKIPYVDTYQSKYLNTEKVLVNKYYYLDKNYVPDNLEDINPSYALNNIHLVHDAKIAFEKMAEKAKEENLTICAMSTYRSYNYQVNLYNEYLKKDSQEIVDTYSSRPGHSEHQTGLAVDIYNRKIDYNFFDKTKEYEWMLKHAHEYGFILRYPKNKEKETKYNFESWHYRYVGVDIATYIYEHNISFEEYYATKIKDW